MKGRYATDAAMSLTKSLDEVSYFSLFSYSVAGYLLTLPIDGVKAASNLFFYTSMLFLVMSGFKEGHAFLCLRKLDLGVWSLGLYVLVVAGAIFLNKQDTINSLSRLRTGLGAQLYVLYSSFLILQKEKTVRLLIAAMAIGYCLLVAKTLYLISEVWITSPSLFSQDFHVRKFSPGYGITTLFFLPVLFGYLVTFRPKLTWRLVGYGAGALGLVLAISYNSTSGVVFVGSYVVYLALHSAHLRFRWGYDRLAVIAVLSIGVLFGGISHDGQTKIFNQYEKAVAGNNYDLLSQRIGIWAIAIDCALDAPWYGYGYGQKKVALLCSDQKYLEPARLKGNSSSEYFKEDRYGSIGFHNQYIENWFIGGGVGFVLWLTIFSAAIGAAWRKRHRDSGLSTIVLPIIVLYLAGCMFNGLWEAQPMTKGLMVLLAWAWWEPAECACHSK